MWTSSFYPSIGMSTKPGELQEAFIARLHQQAEAQSGAELLQTPLEELKTVVYDRLRPPAAKKAAEPSGSTSTNGGPVMVYLLYDEPDRAAAAPLGNFLSTQGLKVLHPVLEGDPAFVRQDHLANLQLCHAALIYWGAADTCWLQPRLRDLLKAVGYGRKYPFRAKSVYAAPPETAAKAAFESKVAKSRVKVAGALIKAPGDFSPDHLAPFLQQIQAGGQE